MTGPDWRREAQLVFGAVGLEAKPLAADPVKRPAFEGWPSASTIVLSPSAAARSRGARRRRSPCRSREGSGRRTVPALRGPPGSAAATRAAAMARTADVARCLDIRCPAGRSIAACPSVRPAPPASGGVRDTAGRIGAANSRSADQQAASTSADRHAKGAGAAPGRSASDHERPARPSIGLHDPLRSRSMSSIGGCAVAAVPGRNHEMLARTAPASRSRPLPACAARCRAAPDARTAPPACEALVRVSPAVPPLLSTRPSLPATTCRSRPAHWRRSPSRARAAPEAACGRDMRVKRRRRGGSAPMGARWAHRVLQLLGCRAAISAWRLPRKPDQRRRHHRRCQRHTGCQDSKRQHPPQRRRGGPVHRPAPARVANEMSNRSIRPSGARVIGERNSDFSNSAERSIRAISSVARGPYPAISTRLPRRSSRVTQLSSGTSRVSASRMRSGGYAVAPAIENVSAACVRATVRPRSRAAFAARSAPATRACRSSRMRSRRWTCSP